MDRVSLTRGGPNDSEVPECYLGVERNYSNYLPLRTISITRMESLVQIFNFLYKRRNTEERVMSNRTIVKRRLNDVIV